VISRQLSLRSLNRNETSVNGFDLLEVFYFPHLAIGSERPVRRVDGVGRLYRQSEALISGKMLTVMSTIKKRDEFFAGGFACKPRSIALTMTAVLIRARTDALCWRLKVEAIVHADLVQ
jgi:hypothetical protein